MFREIRAGAGGGAVPLGRIWSLSNRRVLKICGWYSYLCIDAGGPLSMIPVILLILRKLNQTQAQPVPVLINAPHWQA